MKPNLFVVGAAKAGTTSIVNYLAQYDEVFVPPVKEPHFFGKDFRYEDFSKEYKKRYGFNGQKYFLNKPLERRHICFMEDEKDYLRLYFGIKKEQYAVDGSTGYLYSNSAAKEIFKYNPRARIIISLRNPVERAISHYTMLLGNGNEKEKNAFKAFKKDFYSETKGFGITHLYVEMGLYYEQISRYLAVFPKEHILIIDFSELKTDKTKIAGDIASFLNLPRLEFNDAEKNKTIIPKNGFLVKMQFMRKWIPSPITQIAKKSFLFDQNPKTKVENDEVISFLEKHLEKDWKNTMHLLNKEN